MPKSVNITPLQEAKVPGHGIKSQNISSLEECIPKLDFETCIKLRNMQTQRRHFRQCPNKFQKIESCWSGAPFKGTDTQYF